MVIVREWSEQWLQAFPRASEKTHAHYLERVSAFVDEHGDRELDSISVLEARRIAGADVGRARYVRTMFEDAVSAQVLTDNPFAGVKGYVSSPNPQSPPPEMVLKAADLALTVYPGPFGQRVRAMILVAAFTGIREGAMAKVTVPDVFIRDGEVFIWQRSTKGGKKWEVYVPEPAASALLSVMPAEGLVFTSKRGRPLYKQAYFRIWAPIREALGLSEVNWHKLKHHAVTFFADAGVEPAGLAYQFHGSTDPRTALTYYRMVDKKRVADQMREVLRARV